MTPVRWLMRGKLGIYLVITCYSLDIPWVMDIALVSLSMPKRKSRVRCEIEPATLDRHWSSDHTTSFASSPVLPPRPSLTPSSRLVQGGGKII